MREYFCLERLALPWCLEELLVNVDTFDQSSLNLPARPCSTSLGTLTTLWLVLPRGPFAMLPRLRLPAAPTARPFVAASRIRRRARDRRSISLSRGNRLADIDHAGTQRHRHSTPRLRSCCTPLCGATCPSPWSAVWDEGSHHLSSLYLGSRIHDDKKEVRAELL